MGRKTKRRRRFRDLRVPATATVPSVGELARRVGVDEATAAAMMEKVAEKTGSKLRRNPDGSISVAFSQQMAVGAAKANFVRKRLGLSTRELADITERLDEQLGHDDVLNSPSLDIIVHAAERGGRVTRDTDGRIVDIKWRDCWDGE